MGLFLGQEPTAILTQILNLGKQNIRNQPIQRLNEDWHVIHLSNNLKLCVIKCETVINWLWVPWSFKHRLREVVQSSRGVLKQALIWGQGDLQLDCESVIYHLRDPEPIWELTNLEPHLFSPSWISYYLPHKISLWTHEMGAWTMANNELGPQELWQGQSLEVLAHILYQSPLKHPL